MHDCSGERQVGSCSGQVVVYALHFRAARIDRPAAEILDEPARGETRRDRFVLLDPTLAQMQHQPEPFVLGELEVRARAVTVAELALDADTVSIQVFEADGTTPARGKVMFERTGWYWYAAIDVDANGAATFDAMPRTCEVKVRFCRWNAQRPNGPFTDAIDLGTLRADGKPIVLRLPAR